MKVLQHTEAALVMQEKPWLVWLVGVLFVAGGLFAFVSNERVFGAGFVIAGAGLILGFANTVTATFDRTAGRFRRSIRGLVRNSEITHPLAEIVAVAVEASATGNPSRSYRVALTLTSGVRVPLTSSYSSGKGDKEQRAATIRQFLDMRETPEVPMPGFRDMVGMMFDPNAAERLGEMFGGPVAEYEALVRRDPGNLEARKQLGVALAVQGKPREAREHLQAARDLATERGNPELAAGIDTMLRRMNDAARRG